MYKTSGMLVAGALFGVGLTLPVPAMADSYEGTWHVRGQMTALDGTLITIAPVCQFFQRGNQLSGQCTGPSARGPASGIVNGDNATWEWTATANNSNGQSGVAVFRSTIGRDNVMRGTWTGSSAPGATGTFTAQ